MRLTILLLLLAPVFLGGQTPPQAAAAGIYLRHNLIGYQPTDSKVALAFSDHPLKGDFVLRDSLGNDVFRAGLRPVTRPGWGRFAHYYELDFSAWQAPGTYRLALTRHTVEGDPFRIATDCYRPYPADGLAFMRQQRCGYNPYLDMVCHAQDGRSFYGPMPDSTYVDLTGGWHDAGDQLKYLITGSFATAIMLMAHARYPSAFGDTHNALGQPGGNGLPDILDEAKWGLDWLHRLHPQPDWLFHQVADDRDHRGWKWPDQDLSDYGWGPNRYRAAYFANGQPQGLRAYQSQATGLANLAGRAAAAMALGYQALRNYAGERPYAERCLAAAQSLYALGRAHEGYQQGNSYGAPYRYGEDTWTDDMEWAAALLYQVTGDSTYRADALRYARLTHTATTWMGRDTAEHYRLYPFVSPGHYACYSFAPAGLRDSLAQWYRWGIEQTLARAQQNPFEVGVPFIWCSNNLVTALMTQILLYEDMTGDRQFHDHLLRQRDWLLGRNPWGSSMFTGIPRAGEYPLDVHTSVWALTHEMVPGGLVDGPVYGTIFRQLKGLHLSEPDEFAHLQNPYVVYHDDIGDYSTNEPTMDGTAGALYLWGWLGQ